MGLVACKIGSFPVYTYGILVSIAILLGALAAWGNLKLHHVETAPLLDFLVAGIPAVLVFGRLGFVLHHFSSFENDLLSIPCLWHGGISFYGGMLGMLLVVLGWCEIHGESAWRWLDLLVPAFLLVIVVHELGIFWLQYTVGAPFPNDIPNNHTLAEYVDYTFRPWGYEDALYFQPIALYQAGLQFLAFLAVEILALLDAVWCRIGSHRGLADGCLFLAGAALMAAIRFGCGFYYLNASPEHWLSLGQVLSAGVFLLAAAGFFLRCRSRRRQLFY